MFNYCLPTTKVSIRKPSITVVDQISKNTSNQIYQNKTDKITMHYCLQWGQNFSCGAFLLTKYIFKYHAELELAQVPGVPGTCQIVGQ